MNEAKVIEINKAQSLAGYQPEELREADQWVKDYALARLGETLDTIVMPKFLREYIELHARVHYGSVETDNMLIAMGSYPEWLKVTD